MGSELKVVCDDCGDSDVSSWFVPHEIWNRVVGGPEASDDPGGTLCPTCFIKRAEDIGIIPVIWEITPLFDARYELPIDRHPSRNDVLEEAAAYIEGSTFSREALPIAGDIVAMLRALKDRDG